MGWVYLANVPSKLTDVAFHKDGKLKCSGIPLVDIIILPPEPLVHYSWDPRDDKSGIDMLAGTRQ
tara:strand:- start:630 stop:824 length:195 start_codon:yes stop_codon:yes gene_type:complete